MDEKTLKKLADAYKQGNPEAKKAIDNLKKLALGQGEEAEKAKSILTAIQEYIKKAAKGAKLDYIKSLKHQCAEDEELYYYKKGGSVGCGCKKKEDGGEVKKDCGGSSIVSKFKKMRAGGLLPEILSEKKTTTKPKYKTISPDKNGEYTDNRGNIIITKKGMEEREKTLNANKNEEGKADPNRKQKLSKSNRTPIKACGSKIKKHQEGSVIDKFKALRKGGSLNGIPFYQEGTPEGGIVEKTSSIPKRPLYILPLKVKPVDWYNSVSALSGVFDTAKDGTSVYYESFGKRSKLGDRFNRHILRYYFPEEVKSDTTFEYFPKYGKPKVASSKLKTTDYELLKENFNKIVSKPLDIHYFDLNKVR